MNPEAEFDDSGVGGVKMADLERFRGYRRRDDGSMQGGNSLAICDGCGRLVMERYGFERDHPVDKDIFVCDKCAGRLMIMREGEQLEAEIEVIDITIERIGEQFAEVKMNSDDALTAGVYMAALQSVRARLARIPADHARYDALAAISLKGAMMMQLAYGMLRDQGIELKVPEEYEAIVAKHDAEKDARIEYLEKQLQEYASAEAKANELRANQ